MKTNPRARPPPKPPPTGASAGQNEERAKQQERPSLENAPGPRTNALSTLNSETAPTGVPQQPPPLPIPPEPPPTAGETEEQCTNGQAQDIPEHTEETVPDEWEAEITIRRVLTEVEEIAAERKAEKRRKKLKLYVGWDLVPDKAPNCTRVGFINLKHLSHNRNDSRSRFLIDQMRHYTFNVLMMCEHNVRMHKLEAHHNWYERSSKTLGPQSFIFASNRNDDHNTELRQIGGTAIVAMQETKTRGSEQRRRSTQIGTMGLDADARKTLDTTHTWCQLTDPTKA